MTQAVDPGAVELVGRNHEESLLVVEILHGRFPVYCVFCLLQKNKFVNNTLTGNANPSPLRPVVVA
jgi:hypothetical protein